MEIRMNIKPISVNDCWAGRRFKTPEYKRYEQELLLTLPAKKLPEGEFFRLEIEVGFSSKGSDLSNVIKPLEDILQKRYGFNDNRVYSINMSKKIVKKGDEYFKVKISEV